MRFTDFAVSASCVKLIHVFFAHGAMNFGQVGLGRLLKIGSADEPEIR